MTVEIDEIKQLLKIRYSFLEEVMEKLSEEQLNSQPFPDRRSIAEVMNHLLMVDGISTTGKNLFYKTINLFSGVISKANKKPADASDYEWRSKNRKPRKAKFIQKVKLTQKLSNTCEKYTGGIEKANEKDRKVLHVAERHANAHLKQIQFLLEKINRTG
ncbi:MAG: hypothetical protein ACXAD7_09635 [Candidatus Kariarchaeaceae archaeon]|jgi:hypothetical protein